MFLSPQKRLKRKEKKRRLKIEMLSSEKINEPFHLASSTNFGNSQACSHVTRSPTRFSLSRLPVFGVNFEYVHPVKNQTKHPRYACN